jgi:hypothetical protein
MIALDHLVCTIPAMIAELPREVASQAEYWELSGCEGLSPYDHTLKRLDHLIGQLKDLRAEVQALAAHAHVWNSAGYCVMCHADGAA